MIINHLKITNKIVSEVSSFVGTPVECVLVSHNNHEFLYQKIILKFSQIFLYKLVHFFRATLLILGRIGFAVDWMPTIKDRDKPNK